MSESAKVHSAKVHSAMSFGFGHIDSAKVIRFGHSTEVFLESTKVHSAKVHSAEVFLESAKVHSAKVHSAGQGDSANPVGLGQSDPAALLVGHDHEDSASQSDSARMIR